MDAGSQQSRLDAKLRQYQALCEVAESIAVHRDLHSLLQNLTRPLQRVVRFDAVNVVLYDATCHLMRMHVLESPLLPQDQLMITELPIEEAPAGWVWQTQEPMLMTDIGSYLDRYPRVTPLMLNFGIQTAYVLPLTSVGRRLGALGFASLQPAAWSEEDQEFLQQVAKLVAVAVENAINFEHARTAELGLQRRVEQLRLLLEVGTSIASHLNLRELFEVISNCLRRSINCDGAGLTIYDAESGQLQVYALVPEFKGDVPLTEGGRIPLEGTPGGRAFQSLQTILVNRAELENSPSPLVRRIAAGGVKSGCVAPLVVHGRALGTLDLASRTEDAFSAEDAELLTQIANQIAIAVENAINFEQAITAREQLRHERDRSQLLLEINNAVVSSLNLPELLEVISPCLRRAVHHDFAGLLVYDREHHLLRAHALDFPRHPEMEGLLFSVEGTPSGLAFSSRRPLIVDRQQLDRFAHTPLVQKLRDQGVQSGCSLPLLSRDRALGVLTLMSLRPDNFLERDLELLMQIAGQIAIAVENALAYREIESLKNKLASEKLYLEDEIRTEHNFEELIGESQAFKRILKQVETVATTGSAVLIRGETGTGKELIARAIHDLSQRRERTLVKINCAAIPTGLLESELFGHERGAFTGAISQRIGRFELANHGTLFLDEVGDIPPELQPKLLRVLQEQEFERLGSTRTQRVDVRLIAATNCDLEQMVSDRKYRSDLYYRLNVFPITIPPLRERREDIPALTRFFTQKYARRMKKPITAIPAETLAALTGYSWPGNVRELEHFIERAVILTRGSDLEISFA
ncbi:MAG TPA: sigma 54-interacting transcriptional regulator, partial [Blastocatellia bacterium]|nr:sigma 54-interacting transcriptional regulator [Blastocatellia bacterium]